MAHGGKLSLQVLNEFTAVARRKLGHDWHEIADAIDDALTLLDPPQPMTLELHAAARTLAEQHRLSFYDALIFAAALDAGRDTLYSEDLQHGRSIGALRIESPFIESPP
jgi:predicted nucleic acid-binding protein